MNRYTLFRPLLLGAVVLAMLLAGGAQQPATAAAAASASPATITSDQPAWSSALSQVPTSALSAAEIEGLLYMREEEKLAHDVYLTLYEKWRLPIFQNISNSEATHMAAVKTLLDRYSLPDPAAGKGVGQFSNATLQALYAQLLQQGSQSLASALRVGGAIEEIDILDLQERLANTDHKDIQTVYENLLQGSRNHLRSFVSTLQTQTGEIYQPQYLSQADYEAVINSPMEGGRGGRSGRE